MAYIEDLIAQQVDVIGIIPVSTEALETVLQKARDQGIVVVSHEAPTLKNTDADVEAFTDEAFGEFFMQSLAKAMNYEGEYATIIESLMNPNHNIWTDSAIAYQVANYPDMTCVSSKNETNADVSQAQSICEELMKTYPNLKGIMGTGSADIVGAGLAIENKGMIGKIASVGCTSPADAAQYLESGSVSMIGIWVHAMRDMQCASWRRWLLTARRLLRMALTLELKATIAALFTIRSMLSVMP